VEAVIFIRHITNLISLCRPAHTGTTATCYNVPEILGTLGLIPST
jgi:hypothetical protein